MEILRQLWDRAVSEGGVVSGAPMLFTAAVVVLTAALTFAAWRAIDWSYAARLENSQSQVSLQKDLAASYKDKLGGASPDEAKKRVDRLEAEIAALRPRRLTEEQKSKIAGILNAFKGRSVTVTQDVAAPNSRSLALDLATAFRSAGWLVSVPAMMGGTERHAQHGLLLIIAAGAPSAADTAIMNALKSADLAFDTHQLAGMETPEIVVSTKSD